MVEKTIVVKNESGLHARPAGAFVTLAKKYSSAVSIVRDGRKINGKSILSIMTACITKGTEITLVAEGEDEQEALDGLAAAVEAGLGE